MPAERASSGIGRQSVLQRDQARFEQIEALDVGQQLVLPRIEVLRPRADQQLHVSLLSCVVRTLCLDAHVAVIAGSHVHGALRHGECARV